jgi:hypothetical protein
LKILFQPSHHGCDGQQHLRALGLRRVEPLS